MKIAIVVDMWLTGFDVPSLATMYVYKPMSGHNLMQAIARVNRVFKDKEGGLVVDYVGIASALKQAMNDYTARDKKNYGDTDVAKVAYPKFLEKLSVCRDLFFGYDYSKFKDGTDLERAKTISGAVNFIVDVKNEDKKEAFIREGLLLHQALSLCSSLVGEDDRFEAAFFESVRVLVLRLSNAGGEKKISLPEMNKRINELLKQSIKSDGVINLFSDVGGEFNLFDPKFLEEISKMKEKNLAVELLKKLIAEQISIYRRTNVVKSEQFSEIIQRMMKAYLNGMLTNEEVMVCQQRQDDRADLACLDARHPRALEIAEFLGQLQRAGIGAAHHSVVRRGGGLQQTLVIRRESVGRLDQFALRRVEQAADEQRMLHHDAVPEQLAVLQLAARVFTTPQHLKNMRAIEPCLAQDVLDQQRVVRGEHIAGADAAQQPLLERDQTLHQCERVPVQLPHLHRQIPPHIRLSALPAAQPKRARRQRPVDADAGQALRLLLGAVGEFRDDLAGIQHTAAHHALAQGDCAGEDALKLAQEKFRLARHRRVGRQKARLQKQCMLLHDAGKKQVQLQRSHKIVLCIVHIPSAPLLISSDTPVYASSRPAVCRSTQLRPAQRGKARNKYPPAQ